MDDLDGLVDHTTFRIDYPIYVIGSDLGISVSGHLDPNDPNGGRYVPLFTDQDTAQQFRADSGSDDKGIWPLTRELLQQLIAHALNSGVTHVFIDPDYTRRRRPTKFTIGHFFAAITR